MDMPLHFIAVQVQAVVTDLHGFFYLIKDSSNSSHVIPLRCHVMLNSGQYYLNSRDKLAKLWGKSTEAV